MILLFFGKLCSQYRLITYCVHKLWRVLAAFCLLEGRDTSFPSPQTPLKLPSIKSLPVTVAGHWGLPSEVCAVYSVGRPPDRLCRSSNGCALRLAWAVFPRRNRLLLVLRSSSQLLLRRLCSHVNARKVHSHADCALGGNRLAPVC